MQCETLIAAVSAEHEPDLDATTYSHLHDYQVAGVKWMLRRLVRRVANVALCDEPGVGKTLQTLAVLHYFSADRGRPSLVLAPLSIVGQWASEAQRFFPSLRVFLYAGTKEERQKTRTSLESSAESGCPFDVLVTSYELAVLDSDFLSRGRWNLLVVDEAHRLKNANTVLYKNLNEMYVFKRKIFLTGTPVMNNLNEFVNQLKFLNPNLTDVTDFVADKANCDRLTHALVLRRLATDVNLKLPERKEYLIKIPLTNFQKTVYSWALKKPGGNVLASLRKVCNHPYLFDGVEPQPFVIGDHLVRNSAKLLVLEGLLKEVKNEKTLIFSTSTQFLDIIQDMLEWRSIQYERLDGSVRGEDRYKSIENFTTDRTVSVFLLSVRAGGLGLCLTAASVVIVMDEDFNPHFTKQGIARAYRQGQSKPVTIYRLICQHTLDEIVYRRGVTKLKLSADILNEQEMLSKEEQTQLVAFGLSKLGLPEDTTVAESADENPPVASRSPVVDLDVYDVGKLLASAERVADRADQAEEHPDENDLNILRNFRPSGVDVVPSSRRNRTQRFNDEDRDLIRRVMEQNRKKRLQEREDFQSLAVASDSETDTSGVDESGVMRHLRGDVMSPEVLEDSGTPLVVLPVTSEGRFVSSAFGLLQKQRLPDGADYLKKARKAKALKMGDLHLLEYPDGAYSVGLAVCLSPVDEVLDVAALARAINKISTRYSVHVPRLGDRSGQFYAVERTLQRSAVARGVDVAIYYYSRCESAEPAVKRSRVEAPSTFRSVREFFQAVSGVDRESSGLLSQSTRLKFAEDIPAALRLALARVKFKCQEDVNVVSSIQGPQATAISEQQIIKGGFTATTEEIEFILSRSLSF